MKIQKKRIHSLQNNLPTSLQNKKFTPVVILDENKNKQKIVSLGFTNKMEVGETLLPTPTGSVTRFNSEGKSVPDKTKEKITKYYEFEWTHKEWAGRGRTREVTSSVIRPREVWQRDFTPPPSVCFSISKKEAGKIYITTGETKFSEQTEKDALHKINLLLETFGECEILNEDGFPLIKNIIRLNWNILPPGERPWEEQKKLLKPFLDQQKSDGVRPILEERLEEINNLKPDFTAMGMNGYQRYMVFGFRKQNIYILESAFYGNAIYVFENDWESLSKLTKAEILKNNLQIDRITHNGEKANWIERILKLINKK
jgi:hypothetical protein